MNSRYARVMDKLGSIKFRLLGLGIVLIALGIFVRQFIALPLFQDRVRSLAASQQHAIATYVAGSINYNIETRLALIERLAAEVPRELVSQPEKLSSWIRERQTINPAFTKGLVLLPPSGKGVIAEFPLTPDRASVDFSTSDWFRAALDSGKPVMGKPERERVTGDAVMFFSAAVHDGSGSPVAVLAGEVQLDAPGFLDQLQQTKLGDSGGFLLISPADKLFVASSDPSMVLKPTPRPGINLLHDRAMSGFRGTGVTVNAKGVEELSAMVSVPSTGWFVVARMPTKEAFRPVNELRSFALKASAILGSLVFAVLLFALPRLLRPLSEAAAAIRAMADGKTEIAPLPVIRNDEVGKLLGGFNVLVEKLRNEEAARKASEERLVFLALHDSLTGLVNRIGLEGRLEDALARAERAGSQLALLFCDLDGFKSVNDCYGHDAGDMVLQQVARRLGDGRRLSDTVARIGGDEFIILLSDLDDARAAAAVVAARCLATLCEPFHINGDEKTLGVSIGIALHSGASVPASYLISRADMAMYQVKQNGKGSFFFIDDMMTVEAGNERHASPMNDVRT
ncbi:sensor domain-containing diguanylate cyclase [Noviherbaspirillum sp. CPCC 100848]|uniref:Sensor domain-containing diguanylate cyclase n=1 Tax=Noviherbaspirillum album TaxID=3080276 RepID=A0ABU6JAT7_9BURK|nr:sensor domain-containing diguanylate cyclase [Noviherbaspirillum sp. CPCC 100848]MEC4720772.1 sensor domain-containing diguanylate cyclase [Noviherbaspirillum sp. CPCC 100848]